jgi:hypothetical protein
MLIVRKNELCYLLCYLTVTALLPKFIFEAVYSEQSCKNEKIVLIVLLVLIVWENMLIVFFIYEYILYSLIFGVRPCMHVHLSMNRIERNDSNEDNLYCYLRQKVMFSLTFVCVCVNILIW